MMNQNLKNLLCGELSSAGAYLDRLFHALYEVSEIGQDKEFKAELLEKVEQLSSQFSRCFLSEDSIGHVNEMYGHQQARVQIDRMFQALPILISAVGTTTPWTEKTTTFINSSYQLAFSMHQKLKEHGEIEVQLPRLNILEMEEIPAFIKPVKENKTVTKEDTTLTLIHTGFEEEEEEDSSKNYPLFTLPLDSVQKFGSSKDGVISSLIQQRKKKHQDLVHLGHQSIFEKDFHKALEQFSRALNYLESAEVLTLIGWTYSLLENLGEAKKYCLRAIQVDPDYGPPYNDLGSYLLNEGQIDESFKWFDLAKKAVHYQNREYPYINSGRAWMLKKNLTKALDEFSKALSLAPFNEELHSTVEKLKKSIHKSTDKINQSTLLKKAELPPLGFNDESPGNLN